MAEQVHCKLAPFHRCYEVAQPIDLDKDPGEA